MKSRALEVTVSVLLSGTLAAPAMAQSGTPQTGTQQTQTGQTSTKIPVDVSTQKQTNPQAHGPVGPAPAEPGTAPKETHNKNKNDIDDIGDRKVGGRGLGDWYSTDTEIKMGKQYAMMIESSVRLVQDPVITEYVNRVGQNLVRNSDAKVPFTIKVIDSDEINAFALPGGFFYVNSGLILAADEEAELAGVMAHEIAHVCARHAMREQTRMNYASMASIPLVFVGSWGIYEAANAALSIALPMTFMKFSRSFESEADYLGLQYMYKAGYDPGAFITFFEKIESQEKKKPGTLAKAFSTHPPTPDRIEKSQEEIRQILPARPEYVVNTSEFNDVKARLAALENRKKIINPDQDKNRPTLRRTNTASTTTNPNDPNAQQPGDDRPTLSRRDDD